MTVRYGRRIVVEVDCGHAAQGLVDGSCQGQSPVCEFWRLSKRDIAIFELLGQCQAGRSKGDADVYDLVLRGKNVVPMPPVRIGVVKDHEVFEALQSLTWRDGDIVRAVVWIGR